MAQLQIERETSSLEGVLILTRGTLLQFPKGEWRGITL